MPTRVQFAEEIEPLVQFIEETAPEEIVDQTLAKLRADVSIRTMLTASALAVTRSSDLPPGHHGGPLHPLVGLHALHHLIARLEGENRFLPVLQHVALSNKHIHHPAMGPYALLDFEPVDEGGVEATKQAFFRAVSRGESNLADHYFLWLWDNMPRIEAFDLLLSVALPKNILDDHYFINMGYDATAFIGRLAEIVCHDNFTEMHAFKHHQAVVEEFYATREPWRWRHLVAGAQASAISFGKNMAIYEEALELLHA